MPIMAPMPVKLINTPSSMTIKPMVIATNRPTNSKMKVMRRHIAVKGHKRQELMPDIRFLPFVSIKCPSDARPVVQTVPLSRKRTKTQSSQHVVLIRISS
jgi:hypothetical protein